MSENSFKTWMADLPQETTRVPLCSLAIPGKKYNNKRETTLFKLLVIWVWVWEILSTYSIFCYNHDYIDQMYIPPPSEGPTVINTDW